MIQHGDVMQLLHHWWFAYDNAIYDEWADMFTSDAHFVCRTDTGTTAYEEFVRADVSGRDAVLAWQTRHRKDSPSPLRHNGTDVHTVRVDETSAEYRSYIWVTQIVNGSPSALSTGTVTGSVRIEDGVLRLAEMIVTLDTEDSTVRGDRKVF